MTKLPLHLENEQTVLFNDANEAREAVQAGSPVTKLTAFFELIQSDLLGRSVSPVVFRSHSTSGAREVIWLMIFPYKFILIE